MNPGLLFWTAALVNLGVVCLAAIVGVRFAHRGEIARHRRAMKLASWLVVAFLLSYVGKLVLIGREDMSVWAQVDLWVLRCHELCVLAMLVAGAVAWVQAGRLEGTRIVTRDARDPDADPQAVRLHHRAGWIAVVSGVLGFVLAIGVLVGMYARAAS
ncbi:MAG: DUF420 domain-containing protein [Deltaproteobacteria bacterium]|nr:DUF420 domain-containing protein [Deltaproteobacteria bacterium]